MRKRWDETLDAVRAQVGLTVPEFARLYRMGQDKVRALIARGELGAVNTTSFLCGKPRWVILPHHQAEFERRRAGGPPPKPPRRKKKPSDWIDYFPD
jgi:hypothetical protein